MPCVPMVMPSEMVTVLNSIGVPPASRMPSFSASAMFAQMHVAGANLGPRIRNADDRLVQIFFLKSGPAQIGTRRRAARAFSQRNALSLAFDGHVLALLASGQLSADQFVRGDAKRLRVLNVFGMPGLRSKTWGYPDYLALQPAGLVVLRFEFVQCRGMPQRQADIVEAFEQAEFAEGIDHQMLP